MMSGSPSKSPRVVITGAGHFFPDTVLDNSFFNALDIGSDAAWIVDRTGIVERRSVLQTSEILGLRKGTITRKDLLEGGRIMPIATMMGPCWETARTRAGLLERTVKIDTMIAGTSIPDDDIPAHACSIAAKHGIECKSGFDVNSACSTFVVHLHMAKALIQSGAARNAALFVAERYTTRIDYADRKTCILFGDSAAASIVERLEDCGALGLEILDTTVHSHPTGAHHIRMPDGEFFNQDGQAVQKFAIQKTIHAVEEILERNHLKTSDLAYFIGHQANLRMLTYAVEKLHLTPAQHLFNVDTRGNQGGAGAPGVLSSSWDRFKSGDLIVISVVGSGLTWGAALLRKL